MSDARLTQTSLPQTCSSSRATWNKAVTKHFARTGAFWVYMN
jgi:hypothetical protein